MKICPKYSSSPSIFIFFSMASLIDSSRPLCTLTTYQCLLLGGSTTTAASGAAYGGASTGSLSLRSAASLAWATAVGSSASSRASSSSGVTSLVCALTPGSVADGISGNGATSGGSGG